LPGDRSVAGGPEAASSPIRNAAIQFNMRHAVALVSYVSSNQKSGRALKANVVVHCHAEED